MKKYLMILLLALTPFANAQYRHGCCYRGGYGLGLVAPAVVGGVIGYELARPNPTVIVNQPIPVPPPTESYLYPPPAGYHYLTALDPMCNCYKTVLVPN